MSIKNLDYGEQAECIGKTRVWVLSSPSGLARGFWQQEVWQALADNFNKADRLSVLMRRELNGD